jgi:hypothetical protein
MSALIQIDGQNLQVDSLDGLNDDLRKRVIDGEGSFMWPDMPEVAMPRVTANRMRIQLMRGGTPGRREEYEGFIGSEIQERLYSIPGLWPLGTHCTFGGPDKAGKTTLATEVISALVVPGKRLGGYFAPAEETGWTVWIINAETPKIDFETALDQSGLSERDPASTLFVDHLREMGGPARFDLTNPAMFAEWADKMLDCFECTGRDFTTPDFVIVDGITAIAHSVGRSPDTYYGPFIVAFRQLMDYLGVENSMLVGHTGIDGKRLLGGVESSANQDALWIIDSAHNFSVTARIGGTNVPAMKIGLEAGRPILRPKTSKKTLPQQESGSGIAASTSDLIHAFVTAENSAAREPRLQDIRTAVGGDAGRVGVALDALVAEGRVVRVGEAGRGFRKTYRVAVSGQDVPVAAEGKASK